MATQRASANDKVSNPLTTPQRLISLGVCIVGSMYFAKFISNVMNRSESSTQNPNTKTSSKGYESVIPFTVKQSTVPVIKEGEQFATMSHERIPKSMQLQRSRDFFSFMNMRRSFRHYSDEPVDIQVIRNCIATANTAPSGAHRSPWTFVVVQDAKKRAAIRQVVEAEEQINYQRRMKSSWVDALKPVVSNLHSVESIRKPYLSTAPYLIIVMKCMYELDAKTGKKVDNYYPTQSTGIAAGMLLTALHNANLVSLPSTPMGAEKAIREICGRPSNEKVFLLVPVGYPAENATVPYRTNANWRKDLEHAMVVV